MRTLVLAIFAALSLHTPPFSHSVSRVTAAQLPRSWHPGCPVSPRLLRRVQLTYWGFDGRAHTGAVIANADAVPDLVHVFSRLYAARFPIRRLRPIDAYGGNDERSLEADNTSAFNCRYVIGPGPRRWSVHAYGEAIDLTMNLPPLTLAEGSAGAERARWLAAAEKLLGALVERHALRIDSPPAIPRGFLTHGCKSLRKNQGLVSELTFGDYYFVEALIRWLAIRAAE